MQHLLPPSTARASFPKLSTVLPRLGVQDHIQRSKIQDVVLVAQAPGADDTVNNVEDDNAAEIDEE